MPSIMRCINVTARCATLQRSEALRALGLTGNQHTYVLTVCKNPGVSQEDLAKLIYIHKSNAARQVALLCRAGFLERRDDQQDRRRVRLYPTEKALAALPTIREALRAWNEYLIEDFAPEERAALERMMTRVMERARGYIDAQGRGGEPL